MLESEIIEKMLDRLQLSADVEARLGYLVVIAKFKTVLANLRSSPSVLTCTDVKYLKDKDVGLFISAGMQSTMGGAGRTAGRGTARGMGQTGQRKRWLQHEWRDAG